jgi:proteasome accessory factor C
MRNSLDGRLQRLLAILAALHEQGAADLDELAQRHDISRYQLENDLSLAQLIGVPPDYSPETMPELVIEGDTVRAEMIPPHLRQPPSLTRPEGFAVLTSGYAVLAVDPGLTGLRSAMEKLAAALDLGEAIEIDIDEPPALAAMRRAETERRRVEISYWSAWRDASTVRRVDPLRVFFTEREWYAACWDHHSGELRWFRVDRIESVTDTDEMFDPYDIEVDLSAFRPPADADRVVVRFPPDATWVREYVEHESVESPDDDADGWFTVGLTVVGTTWLERLLLRTGGQVVAPEALADLTADAARRVLAAYE